MKANRGGQGKPCRQSERARAPVIRSRKDPPWMYRRGRLKRRWWFGSDQWGGNKEAGSGEVNHVFFVVGENGRVVVGLGPRVGELKS